MSAKIKYHCADCGKRYVEWGAKKLGFQCPDCEDTKLIPVEPSGTGPKSKKPSLRRAAKKLQASRMAVQAEAVPAKEIEDDSDSEADDNNNKSKTVVTDLVPDVLENGTPIVENPTLVDEN